MTAPVQEGEVLAGKYQVERILGQGGMGVVVAAKHLQLEQKVALKFLLPEALSNQDAVIRFEREAKAAVKIQSEHVAKVLDVGKLETGAPYMVMEYLTGNDLADVLKVRGVPAVEEAVDWLLQACEAMAEAHSYRIIHRDLKPKNLFVIRRPDGSSALKVLDFGISKTSAPGSGEAAGLTNTTAIMGSPLYMSPEQLRSSRDVDPRTDLWSLGVILYELLTGHPPFQAETMPQLCMAIVTDPPPPMRNRRPDLPDGLEEIVLRCLEKDPQNRYENVAQFARALGEFASPRGRMSVERIARILQNTGSTDTDPIPASRNQGPFIPAGSTSTAWAESQRSKSNRALKTNTPTPAAGETTAQNNNGSKSSMFIALGGVAALLAVGGVFFMNSQKSNATPTPPTAVAAPPPPTTAAEPASNLIEIKISATPADAKIFLDDTPLSGNPASTKMKADGAAHQIRVEAAGHTTHRQLINFEKGKNIDLPITLTEAAPANTKPTGRPNPNPGPGTPAKTGGKGSKIDTKDPYAQ